jgi:hypothetical protein
MSKVFDQLLTSRPVDKAAARVIGGGINYEPDKIIAQRHWSAPPPLAEITPLLRANRQFRDMTGISFGRFKVVGYLGILGSDKQAKPLWLVRCACGDYESRTRKSISNTKNSGDRCDKCRHLVHLKRREAFLRNPTAPQPETGDL